MLTASAEAGLIDQQEYFQKRVASHNLSHYYLLERGDFAYNHSSSGNAVLGIIKRLDAYDSGCLSTLYIVFHPKRDIDSDYLLHYFESSAWHGDVAGMVTEGARNHGLLNISPDTFFTARCSFPSLPEQRRIGKFFIILDNLIAAAERQEALLRQKKQAYLQLMFPQESETEPQLRFSGFNDAWKRIALRSVLKINEERNTASEFGFDKTISVSTMRFKPEGNGAAHASLETYRVLRVGDVAFEGNRHKEYPYGHVVINDIGDGLMSSRFRSFRPTQLICVPFWKYLLQNRYIMTPLLLRSTMRGTLMNELVVDDFLKQRTPMPSLQEQLEIGDFFETLDRLIENAEGRIAQLRKMKSSYLQKLFV
ncbi:restriction endonuclease subunit S [Bifidobacterium apri]|uniref:restriction endonuclease subunit S n=1 Tax=Bifidobacterium apri TaxID=1769423 RepID=UPI003993A5E8